jgi:hypothetical protein
MEGDFTGGVFISCEWCAAPGLDSDLEKAPVLGYPIKRRPLQEILRNIFSQGRFCRPFSAPAPNCGVARKNKWGTSVVALAALGGEI